MSLTNEDLFAISQLLDVKLDARLKPIENDIRDMKGEIMSLKKDMQYVKGEIVSMKSEIVSLKKDLQSVKGEIVSMKGEIASLKKDMQSVKGEIIVLKNDMKFVKGEIIVLKDEIIALKGDMQSAKEEIHRINLCHENIILPRLNTIESCYTSTYNRYKEYADKMDAAFVDIDLLKKVAADHSEKFQKLA